MRKAIKTAGVEEVDGEPSARDTLLRAASDLMIERGTSDVSLHAIARQAKVTAPLVKYYFGSKEGLLLALVERDAARSLAQLDELLAMTINPLAKLRIHVTGIMRTYARYPYLNGLLLRDTGGPAFERIKRDYVQPLIAAQRRIIEEGVASGHFSPIDPDKAYFVIMGTCNYLFATRVACRDLMDGAPADDGFASDYIRVATDLIVKGIAAR